MKEIMQTFKFPNVLYYYATSKTSYVQTQQNTTFIFINYRNN